MIAERYTDYMYNLIDRVITEIPPRESCSDAEKEAGRLFASEISPACSRVETETFTCSPKAFVGFFPYLVILYAAGVVAYFFFPAAAALLGLIGFCGFFFETVRYKELLDPLFPKREGENVAGFVQPSGEVKRRVYVSGHLDAAYEFNIWYWFKGFSTVLMVVALLAVLGLFGFGLARAIAQPVGLPETTVYWVFGWVLVGLFPLVSPFLFFHTNNVVPGAMDDMAGVAVVAAFGKYLAEARERGEWYPENTEVVLLGLSSEEAGLRGSKRYAAAHRAEAASTPTSAIFLDGIYDQDFLSVFTYELWPGGKLDKSLCDLTCTVAESYGWKIRRSILPLGATDATAFSREGIPAVNISLWDTTRLVPHYHTRHDTIEKIKPESLAVALQLAIDMTRNLDTT